MKENAGKTYDCVALTYDVPHRKTYDTLCLLKASGYHNVLVWATPMRYAKKFHPIYEHRPPVSNRIRTDDLCRNFGYDYFLSERGYEDMPIDSNTPVLICGAGIIPDDIRKRLTLINAHPGYIPLARGLDAFKWAIHEGAPIGVTTHLIGDEVDAGAVIERRRVPVYGNDTFHALAQRVYETEISMLAGALEKLREGTTYIPAGNNALHKRMGPEIEKDLLREFALLVKTQAAGNDMASPPVMENNPSMGGGQSNPNSILRLSPRFPGALCA